MRFSALNTRLAEIEQFLKWSKLPYRHMQNVSEETADILALGKVIGWFSRPHGVRAARFRWPIHTRFADTGRYAGAIE